MSQAIQPNTATHRGHRTVRLTPAEAATYARITPPDASQSAPLTRVDTYKRLMELASAFW